jgi:hypothetical protein
VLGVRHDLRPEAETSGRREIEIIARWKPHAKNALRGFFSAILPSGMIFHDSALPEKSDARWIGLPSKGWTGQDGIKQFAKLVEFRDRANATSPRDQVLAALDRYVAEARQ